ncbi:hypothetical protein [Caldisphaera lagunensis]|uniref:hypothetical protein n=1 Tax=Caldisphaera lagunensis TaxID=200415 RepID=UPI0012FCAFEA|nr:hypothetical protein [Caldisphaera lagunensis]
MSSLWNIPALKSTLTVVGNQTFVSNLYISHSYQMLLLFMATIRAIAVIYFNYPEFSQTIKNTINIIYYNFKDWNNCTHIYFIHI